MSKSITKVYEPVRALLHMSRYSLQCVGNNITKKFGLSWNDDVLLKFANLATCVEVSDMDDDGVHIEVEDDGRRPVNSNPQVLVQHYSSSRLCLLFGW